MQRGISPIVAVVLLIAISVIAATGIWFWVGGLASKQPTRTPPIPLQAQTFNCTNATTSTIYAVGAIVQNLGASTALTTSLYLVGDNGSCVNASVVSIPAQQQTMVVFNCATPAVGVTRGRTYTVYAAGSGSAAITC